MKQRIGKLVDALQFWAQRQQSLLADLLSLVQDGVPLNQAITTLCAIYEGVPKKVAEQMADELSKGHTLAQGMQGWFPMTIVEMVRAGEEGGTFIQALESAVGYYRERVFAMKIAIQSMMYPVVVILVALIMLVVIKNSVLTDFASIKSIYLWPPIGRQLYALANFIQYWWWFVVIFLIALIVGTLYLLQNFTGLFRHTIDAMPILSLYRRLAAARFMETLGLLVTNGVSLKKSLHIIQRNAEPYLSWHLLLMEYRLSGGQENIADVLDTQLINQDDLIRLRVMAIGKGFAPALVSLGRQALQRYGQSVSITVKITGGILLGVGALLAAMIVFGIYSVGSVVAS
jgi:type II secretory pathway component PulF